MGEAAGACRSGWLAMAAIAPSRDALSRHVGRCVNNAPAVPGPQCTPPTERARLQTAHTGSHRVTAGREWTGVKDDVDAFLRGATLKRGERVPGTAAGDAQKHVDAGLMRS